MELCQVSCKHINHMISALHHQILNKAKPFLPRGAAARNWESANSSPPWPVLHRCIHKQSKQRSIYQLFRVNCFWEMSPFFNELFCAVKITVSTECSSPKYSFQIKIKHILMFLVIAKCFQWSKLFDLWLWCRSTWSCWNQKRVEACCKQVSLMKNVSNLLLTAKLFFEARLCFYDWTRRWK